MGGEKLFDLTAKVTDKGSPPRGRGKVLTRRLVPLLDRITPAWAGKRAGSSGYYSTAGDHPRVGGEKWALSPRHWVILGSPPRGRGKGSSGSLVSGVQGITPAWAGKSESDAP